jgi:hypothetical protein
MYIRADYFYGEYKGFYKTSKSVNTCIAAVRHILLCRRLGIEADAQKVFDLSSNVIKNVFGTSLL